MGFSAALGKGSCRDPHPRVKRCCRYLLYSLSADRVDQLVESAIVNVALAPGDFLGASDLQALTLLDDLDELGPP